MARQADVSFAMVEPFRRMRDLAAIKSVTIDIENLRAIERDGDLLAAYFDLFVVPRSDGTQVAVFRADAVVKRAVVLVRK